MFVVPFGYLTVWEMTESIEAATLSAVLILAGWISIQNPYNSYKITNFMVTSFFRHRNINSHEVYFA